MSESVSPERIAPSARDFKILTLQSSVFTRGDSAFKTSKVLGVLLEKFSELLDGDPHTLPTMPAIQLPPELPHVFLKSSNGKFNVNVGPTRIDVVQAFEESSLEMVKEFLTLAQRIHLRYLGQMSATPCRLAWVVTRTAELSDPAKTLAGHFCKQSWIAGPLNRPSDFELHSLKRFMMNGTEVNSWMRCKTRPSVENASAAKAAIVVENDINTLSETASTTKFDVQHIQPFFECAAIEADSIVRAYFPD